MKITIEPYAGGVYTATCEAEYVGDVIDQFKRLLVSAGYHPETIDQHFPEEESWFPEDKKRAEHPFLNSEHFNDEDA